MPRCSFAPPALATWVALTLQAVAPPSAAEVVSLDGSIWLKGEILPQDVRALGERKREGMVVNLDSGGGQLISGIAIGKLLRQTNGVARVKAGSSCFSACVFVLAGAPYREVQAGAVIAIHRPYDPREFQLSPVQQEKKQATLDAFVRGYLRSVNIPPALYDAMLNEPGGRTLSPAELGWYGLNANDRKRTADPPGRAEHGPQ